MGRLFRRPFGSQLLYLVAGNITDNAFYYASRVGERFLKKPLESRFFVSNECLGEPWEKCQRGDTLANSIRFDHTDRIHEDVIRLLSNTDASKTLPDTGLPDVIENELSRLFVASSVFGTVSSTSFVVDIDTKKISFKEKAHVHQ